MSKDKIKKAHGQDHSSCNFGIKEFNKTKRNKEFLKTVRAQEKKEKEHKYRCPAGYEWDLDTKKCVPVAESAPPVGDKQKPSVPQNLRVTFVGATSISLAWDASTDNVGVLAYKIFFKEGTGTTYAVTTRGLVANFKDFKPNTIYSFYVKAVDEAGNLSNASPKVQAKTLAVQPPPPLQAVIYLDFNGGVVSGTYWNTNGDIPYAPSGLTITEEDLVVEAVRQDFAPFDVFVTDDKAIYDAANPLKRTWVIVTESWEWYCGAASPCAGGVGYLNSMFWGDKTPCWVFSSALSHFTKYVAEAASHETGHTIGLRHQSSYDANCVKTSEYNWGNSECACAPIMGASYNQPDGKWWIGPNSLSCMTIQDDYQFISSKLGLKQ